MAWRRAISSPGLEYSFRGGASFSNARLIFLHYVFPQEEEKAAREILLGAFEIADGSRGGDFRDRAISQAQCALRLSSGHVESPFRIASSSPLLQECFGETLNGRPGRYFRNQHWHLKTPLVVHAWMQAGEVRDDCRFPAAAFANNRTAVRFGGGIVTVKARLDSSDRGLEQRIFDQYTFRPVHGFRHWFSSMPEVSLLMFRAATGK